MADNFAFTLGAGATAASDDIAGVHYPRYKLIFGPDGTNSGDVSDANPFPTKITDGTRTATVRDTGASDSLNVAITDAAGAQITTFPGTEYTEGGTDATITGTAIMWEDTSDTLRAVSAAKPLPITVISGVTAPPSKADDAAFTIATDAVSPMGALFDNVAPDSVDEGDVGIPRMSANRNLYIQVRDGNTPSERGLSIIANNTTPAAAVVLYDGSGNQMNQLVAQQATDAAYVSGHGGALALTVRRDTATALVSTSGDYQPPTSNSNGALYIDINTDFRTSEAKSPIKLEDEAATSGSPGVSVLAVRSDTLPTNAGTGTDGDYARLFANNQGALLTSDSPNTYGALSSYRNVSLQNTPIEVKSTAGVLYSLAAFNLLNGNCHLKFWDQSGTPVVGTDVPKLTIPLKFSDVDGEPEPTIIDWSKGIQFNTKIWVAAVLQVADSGTGNVSANQAVVNIGYK